MRFSDSAKFSSCAHSMWGVQVPVELEQYARLAVIVAKVLLCNALDVRPLVAQPLLVELAALVPDDF